MELTGLDLFPAAKLDRFDRDCFLAPMAAG
jgi:hypothetical protein